MIEQIKSLIDSEQENNLYLAISLWVDSLRMDLKNIIPYFKDIFKSKWKDLDKHGSMISSLFLEYENFNLTVVKSSDCEYGEIVTVGSICIRYKYMTLLSVKCPLIDSETKFNACLIVFLKFILCGAERVFFKDVESIEKEYIEFLKLPF